MAANMVEICNMALDNIGVTNKITALTDDTKEAKACARWATTVRDTVLRDFPWPFARSIAELAPVLDDAGEPTSNAEFALVYALPIDLLKARRVFVVGSARNAVPHTAYSVFLNDAGTAYVLGCDLEDLAIEYTRKFDTDARVSLIPAPVVDAMTWKLAARLAIPLAVEAVKAQDAENMYRLTVAQAFADQSGEQQFDDPQDPDWIKDRG